MIKSLRKKFILINMLLVSLVLLVVFSAMCISEYNGIIGNTNMNLQRTLDKRDGQMPQPPKLEIGNRPPEGQGFMSSPVFVLKISFNGSVELLYSENISVSEDDITLIAEKTIASGMSEGTLPDYNLRFMTSDEYGYIKIAYIEMSESMTGLRNTILTSVVSVAAALAAFFLVSLFLSKWTLKPVEKAWEQQRRFVADASHELKTPLTVILANTGILKSHPEDTIDMQMNWVSNTETEAQRMKKLVDNLLFLAKSDDAKTTAVYNQLNLSDLAFSTALTFESVAFERGVTLDTEDLRSDIHVIGDTPQLGQLISILLDNAIKYSEASGTVKISLESRQSKAILNVNNKGGQITPEDIKHVFERFYRADKSRSNEGYGLGLSIAKNIAELHKGKIYAESNSESGTTFTVILPVC